MNIGFWSCIILVIPFVIIGVLFAIFKEKATKFVSGFNSFSKEEQAMYDKAQISRDIRNQCFIWTVIMLAGATLSCLLSGLEVLPVDCNSVEIQSVFHNPLVELAVYRHPCHHQKTGQPHPSGMEVYWRIRMTHKKLICNLR